ncbi:MAG: hypothetical protein KDD77_02430 [Caldilineaceae bacterium]|nr:hypothetical protein [Caldilineaceae bacterium]
MAWTIALPEVVLAAGVMVLLMLGVFRGNQSTGLVSTLASLLLVVVLVVSVTGQSGIAFEGLFVENGFTSFAKVLILVASAIAIVMATDYCRREDMQRFEYPILMLIATLGMMMIARGLALVLSTIETGTVKPIYFNDTPEFRQLTMLSFLDPIIKPIAPTFSVPNAVFIMFGAALVAAFILGKTVLGRYTVAIGSNEEATRLSGVNVANWKTAVYALGGVFSGLAGVMIASRLNSAQPALGVGYELDAIAAVVIGGTSLSGGEGTILGTIIGAFIISTLTNGLRIMNVPQEWQFVVTGVIVILAVYLDILRRRRS